VRISVLADGDIPIARRTPPGSFDGLMMKIYARGEGIQS
jgi:hypothetical protein